jgi:hypothetical protein
MCDPTRRAFSTTSLSASGSDSGTKISAVFLSMAVTIQGLQQYASEEGLRKPDHWKRGKAPTVTSMDN